MGRRVEQKARGERRPSDNPTDNALEHLATSIGLTVVITGKFWNVLCQEIQHKFVEELRLVSSGMSVTALLLRQTSAPMLQALGLLEIHGMTRSIHLHELLSAVWHFQARLIPMHGLCGSVVAGQAPSLAEAQQMPESVQGGRLHHRDQPVGKRRRSAPFSNSVHCIPCLGSGNTEHRRQQSLHLLQCRATFISKLRKLDCRQGFVECDQSIPAKCSPVCLSNVFQPGVGPSRRGRGGLSDPMDRKR